jgi:hypothetical protein
MGDYSESESLEGLDKTVIAQIADEPTFARQFEVLFPMPSLFLTQCQFWSGAFEVESVEVEEDLDGSGAHLSVDESDGHYTLTHDGPGNHRLRVTGIFREPLEADAGACGPQSGPIEVPLAFTVELHVQRVVNATGLPPLGCNAEPFVLSGRSYPGTPVRLWNEQGEIMQPVNVYDSYPLEVIIETEKEAQIEQAGSSLRYDGLIVTGEPQKIRLSTSYGPLLTYHVVDLAAIDAWDIEFWARAGQDVLYPNRPLTLDTEPAVAPGKALGAYATMKVGKVPICSPIFTSDFSITRLTPEVCDVALNGDTDPTPGVPGFLATFFDAAGTCELDLSFPAANGGEGLTRHLSTVFVPPADP